MVEAKGTYNYKNLIKNTNRARDQGSLKALCGSRGQLLGVTDFQAEISGAKSQPCQEQAVSIPSREDGI